MRRPTDNASLAGAAARRADRPAGDRDCGRAHRVRGPAAAGLLLLLLLAGPGVVAQSQEVEVEQLAKTTTSWDGTALPRYPRAQPEITILHITIPPHTRLPLHKHPVINAGVLLRGSLTVESEDGKVLHLDTGDSIVELVNQWHYGRNDGDEPAELIVFYAGIPGEPITIARPNS
jgi:quercetin dioxygenase-like cupin family protein